MNNKQITKKMTFDNLTGVLDTDSFNHAKESELNNVTLIFCDIRDLHKINLVKGWEEGNKVLKEVATMIRKYFPEDKCFRVGGNSFVAVDTVNNPYETYDFFCALCDLADIRYERVW